MHQKPPSGRTLVSRQAGRAYSTPSDPVAGFRGGVGASMTGGRKRKMEGRERYQVI